MKKNSSAIRVIRSDTRVILTQMMVWYRLCKTRDLYDVDTKRGRQVCASQRPTHSFYSWLGSSPRSSTAAYRFLQNSAHLYRYTLPHSTGIASLQDGSRLE